MKRKVKMNSAPAEGEKITRVTDKGKRSEPVIAVQSGVRTKC